MALERGYKWKLSSCADVKKSKENSAKIIHRNSALKSIFRYFYAIIAIEHVFPFYNIRWVPRAMLKTEGCALGFQHLPRNPANVNEQKNMFDPYIEQNEILTSIKGRNSVANLRKMKLYNPNIDLINDNVHTKYG